MTFTRTKVTQKRKALQCIFITMCLTAVVMCIKCMWQFCNCMYDCCKTEKKESEYKKCNTKIEVEEAETKL